MYIRVSSSISSHTISTNSCSANWYTIIDFFYLFLYAEEIYLCEFLGEKERVFCPLLKFELIEFYFLCSLLNTHKMLN